MGSRLSPVEKVSYSPKLPGEQESAEQSRLEGIRARSLEQDIEERKKYGNRIFWFSMSWVVCIVTIILADGIELPKVESVSFDISETVLLALMGTTTVNILGALFIVMRYLFPQQNKRHQEAPSHNDLDH